MLQIFDDPQDLAAQAAALCEDEEEAVTSYLDIEEEEYVDEEEAEEPGLHRPELARRRRGNLGSLTRVLCERGCFVCCSCAHACSACMLSIGILIVR